MSRGFAVAANVKAEVVAAAAREAEGAGYTSFWVNHPGPFDGLGALATAARETRRIGLGIGVIPLHTRGPQSIVEGARAHALPLDPLWLGVGSPNPKPLDRVRAGVAAPRQEPRTKLLAAAPRPRMWRPGARARALGRRDRRGHPARAPRGRRRGVDAGARARGEALARARRPMTEEMTRYYARRAGEYERVYDLPAWQPALAELRRRVPAFFAGRSVFEVACGTGYWTAHVATTARGVHATDVNEETLALARARPWPRDNVTFERRDAYTKNAAPPRCDAGFAAGWLSHVHPARIGEFLDPVHSHLLPGAGGVMFGARDDPNPAPPARRT